MKNKPDIIILASEKNVEMLNHNVPWIYKNIEHNQIYIIANQRNKERIDSIPYVIFFDETNVYPGLSYDSVADIIETIAGERKRAGWYLQQFIKMAWASICKSECYITIDADTFPLNPITYIDEAGKYLLTQKIEFHQPYFDSIDRLFNGRINRIGNFSFIAENMVFDVEVMKEMLCEISNNDNIPGTNFFEKILYSINKEDILKSGFSEFETYGNYISIRHPQKVRFRKLRTLREAAFLFGRIPTDEELVWASKDYDIISIEGNGSRKTLMTSFVSLSITKKMFHLKTLASLRKRVRTIYRKIRGIKDFQYD